MTIIVVITIAVAILGFQLGFHLRDISDKLKVLLNREPEPEGAVMTPLPAGQADISNTSSIITPKTPDQIEREEQQKVRNLL